MFQYFPHNPSEPTLAPPPLETTALVHHSRARASFCSQEETQEEQLNAWGHLGEFVLQILILELKIGARDLPSYGHRLG